MIFFTMKIFIEPDEEREAPDEETIPWDSDLEEPIPEPWYTFAVSCDIMTLSETINGTIT
jgi:hypothetical protein